MNRSELVSWAIDRLVHVHGDSENADFIHSLRSVPGYIEGLEYWKMNASSRIQELEEGIRKALAIIAVSGHLGNVRTLETDAIYGVLEALLPESKIAKTPAAIARATGLENEVEDAQAKTGKVP